MSSYESLSEKESDLIAEFDGGRIILPEEDNELIAFLQAKLLELRERVADTRPAQLFGRSSVYKVEVLERLLKNGTVYPFQLASDLKEEWRFFEIERLINAISVIRFYVEERGRDEVAALIDGRKSAADGFVIEVRDEMGTRVFIRERTSVEVEKKTPPRRIVGLSPPQFY